LLEICICYSNHEVRVWQPHTMMQPSRIYVVGSNHTAKYMALTRGSLVCYVRVS